MVGTPEGDPDSPYVHAAQPSKYNRQQGTINTMHEHVH